MDGPIIIPGKKRSQYPDECGLKALEFVVMIRDNQMWFAWHRLSKESQGLCKGSWSANRGLRPVDVYKKIDEFDEKTFRPFLDALRTDLLTDWGQSSIENCSSAVPTRYLDNQRALVPLPIGTYTEITEIVKPTSLQVIIVPMLFEDEEWKVHLPGSAWTE